MNIKIDIPNTTNDSDGNRCFVSFIKDAEIEFNNSIGVQKYQGVGENVGASGDEALNHCLALLHYGVDSDYEKKYSAIHGTLEQNEYEQLKKELEATFQSITYSFTDSSVVFKGLNLSKPYYEHLNLSDAQEDDVVIFPGYLSTTVSREKAETFIRSDIDLILVISGLQNARCIVPYNSEVVGAKDADNPEQEILLDKGTKLKVTMIEGSTYYLEVQA
ncbi:hypothetical protein MADA3029_1060001 [Vibrio nigripulchritudo MADA3029]|uniref:ADP-ribosyltransferase n=1 Tax=Vibrio nigripulchritudo TaxID=28173 RepID=UPI0003B1E385|nr:ADP-ribosyltransferase [Vibrio nigripulchritudo]CCN45230.1 hypothetical protein VIBNIMADA3020_1000001 [Vibrio nigripulchritudo MADA3020]CCN54736.1 hypothetical protein VIBNIMADA3021_580001 [Vibrio nigripulchritudo MADA3021]CCN56960.1 hypothetical protein MADA3029_1060001 [Vibrio nigripulchritudo MADA3029]